MFHTRSYVLLVSVSLSLSLACSSSSDDGQASSVASTNTSVTGGRSASITMAGAGTGGTSPVVGSGGDPFGSIGHPASGGGLGNGGWAGATSQASSISQTGGTAGGPSTSTTPLGGTSLQGGRSEAGASGSGGTATGGTSLGGASATSDRSSTAGAGRPASGGTTSQGGTNNAGGTSGVGGTTGPSDLLCPPGISRTITVAKDGSGQYGTVQAAVNSISSGSTAHIRIDIKAGTYTEKLTIASRSNLCLVGANATTTILSYGDSNASTGGTATSASVHIGADDFSAANLTFQNTYGAGSQAVALRATGNRQQFLNCRFVGYQDTLYTHNGSQYFRNCYVQGNTDYVFGGATAVLQDCEARNVENGSAVAAPNTDADRDFGIVFLGGKFTAASGVKSVALGRPWGADGFAAYLNVDLGSHISAGGFVAMSGNQPQNARFHEYASTGGGANASARSSYQLTAAQAANYTLSKIFGDWTPTYSQ